MDLYSLNVDAGMTALGTATASFTVLHTIPRTLVAIDEYLRTVVLFSCSNCWLLLSGNVRVVRLSITNKSWHCRPRLST